MTITPYFKYTIFSPCVSPVKFISTLYAYELILGLNSSAESNTYIIGVILKVMVLDFFAYIMSKYIFIKAGSMNPGILLIYTFTIYLMIEIINVRTLSILISN